MYFIILFLIYFQVSAVPNDTAGIFNIDPDIIFKSVLGREPDRIRETTHEAPDIPDSGFLNYTGPYRYFYSTDNGNVTPKDDTKKSTNEPKKQYKPQKSERIKPTPEIENMKRELEIERIFNNDLNPLPNFDNHEDDPDTITRRFDKLKAEIQRDGRRRYREVRIRNKVRNRTITAMEHFVYATRYKLPYSQILRRKYYRQERYRIGYCYGLMYQLKRQQILMFTHLSLNQYSTSTLHMHMRLYEKVVRLDVDIKDTIRLIRIIESRRRLKEDPNYYETYIDIESSFPPNVRPPPPTLPRP